MTSRGAGHYLPPCVLRCDSMADTRATTAAALPGGAPTDGERARRQAAALRLPFDPLEPLSHDAELWSQVPIELLARFSCVPVGKSGGRLTLAFSGLDEITRIDELEYLLARPIDAVVAPADRVAEALRRHRGGEILLEQASESLRLQLVSDTRPRSS